ncbi:unnamed protein product [Absidia cylindrospora]
MPTATTTKTHDQKQQVSSSFLNPNTKTKNKRSKTLPIQHQQPSAAPPSPPTAVPIDVSNTDKKEGTILDKTTAAPPSPPPEADNVCATTTSVDDIDALRIPTTKSTNNHKKQHRRNVSIASTVSSNGMCLIDHYIERLLEAGYGTTKGSQRLCLNVMEVDSICHAAMDILLQQPTLLELSPPVKIVGDTHGQYSDLIRLFQMSGHPPSSNYLFLGDYVDRGKQSLETMLLLLCYKIKYPETFFLLRGNHENQNVTRVYGFYDECKRRLSVKMWRLFIDVFNTLPIAALVGDKIFCVHGGLSPSLRSLDDIRRIQRPVDIPEHGLLIDLLWSDPSDTASEWEDNERGVSYCFGKKVINEFLAKFDLDLVCRAHMVVEDGYEFFNDRTLVTVFSAPAYCGEFDNNAAVMSVDKDLMCSFQLLTPANHPLCKRQVPRTINKTKIDTTTPL